MSFPEQDRAVQILEKEFGPRWKQIVQELGTKELRQRVGKELTSFMAFPERGSGGNNKWRGNCSPEVVRAILRYVLECKHYYGKQTQDFTLLDPMSGSGTSQAAAQSLGVRSLLYDLNPAPACGIGGWDALRDEVDDSADLIFLHPPYHNLIPYSGNMWGTPHKDDLSRCSSYPEFVEKLNYIVQKLFMALRRDGRLAILVGDIRTKGSFYSMQHDLMRVGQMEAFIVKGQYNCVSDTRSYHSRHCAGRPGSWAPVPPVFVTGAAGETGKERCPPITPETPAGLKPPPSWHRGTRCCPFLRRAHSGKYFWWC